MHVRRLVPLGLLLAALVSARAEVRLNPLFSDHLVLQQGREVPVFGTAAPGEQVAVIVGPRRGSAVADAAGRWMVRLGSLPAGGPLVMTVAGSNTLTVNDVLVGEVWVCGGQSNMQWTLGNAHEAERYINGSADDGLRLLTVRRQATDEPLEEAVLDQPWAVCGPESVRNFSAVGYHFGAHLREKLGVPVGLISSNYGGTPAEAWTRQRTIWGEPRLRGAWQRWMELLTVWPETMDRYREALSKWETDAAAARQAGTQVPQRPGLPYGPTHVQRPGGLHNAMIAPLQPYAVAGAIWYQGESNAGRAYEYRTLFPAMIEDWRDGWGQGDFPFLFVQLAPFMAINPEPMTSAWAELREAQLLTTTAIDNTAMAVIIDVGEENDIHPRRKQPVGERLGIAARALAYGERILYRGPTYHHADREGSRMRVHFTSCGNGMEVRGESITGFTIAGADQVWHNAVARLAGGDEVLVESPAVPAPMAVRYGWANYPVVNLWNSAGLPASPFRSDDWPGVTGP